MICLSLLLPVMPHYLKDCRYLLIKKAIKSKNILAKRVAFMYNNIKKQVRAVFS